MDFHISQLLPDINPSDLRPKIRNPKQYALSLFVEKLNSERGERKPLPAKIIAIKMSHLDTEDLHAFYKQCDTASCGFSRYWWWALDVKKHPKLKRLTFRRQKRYN